MISASVDPFRNLLNLLSWVFGNEGDHDFMWPNAFKDIDRESVLFCRQRKGLIDFGFIRQRWRANEVDRLRIIFHDFDDRTPVVNSASLSIMRSADE